MINRIETLRLKLLTQGRKIINLSSGNTNEHGIRFPAAILKKSLQNFWKDPAYKPDPKGSIEARKAIALFYKKRGFKIDPEQIILTSGTSESYFYIFKMLAKPGDAVLLPQPGYPLFEEIARLADIEVCFYKLKEETGWQADFEDVEKQIQKSAKGLVLISPHNPTGSVLSSQNLKTVIGLSQKYNVPIISDEVFSEYMFDRKRFPRVAQISDDTMIFTLNGISKTYCLPGLKLSWIVVSGPKWQETIEELERSADIFLATNSMAQAMLPIIFKDGQSFLESTKKLIEQNRNLAIEILGKIRGITFHKPEGGFYLFVKIHKLHMTDEEFALKLMEKTGIFVHPGYFYDYDDGLYIVISLAFKTSALKKYLQKLADFVSS